MLGLAELEGEGIELLVGAEPDIAVGPHHHVGLEDAGIFVAEAGIDAVGRYDQVGVGEFLVALDLVLEHQLDAEFLAAVLQDVQHLLAADADEAVAAGADLAALEDELDVVPVVEGHLDGLGGLRVPLAHRLHGGVREDHAPAERVVRAVALDHRDLVLGVLLLHQEGEVESSRAAANTDDAHLPFSGWFNPSARASESPTPNVSTEWT